VSAPESDAPPPAKPAAAPVATTDTGSYRIPSLGWRILGGALRVIPLVILLIGVPVAILTFLQAHGIALPLPIEIAELAGIALTILIVARYILKPTRLYGPIAIAVSTVTLLYLYYLWVNSHYTLAIPGADVSITVAYGEFILLLMLVSALTLAAGVLTTIEDVRSPRQRLPFDFPP
jgi:hypothetical protein